MIRPVQNQFKIRLFNSGVSPNEKIDFKTTQTKVVVPVSTDYTYIDIEQFVENNVVYEENVTMLNSLTFTIDKYADVIARTLYLGKWVLLYGGYYSDDGSGVRLVFKGTISRLVTTFPDNGVPKITVEAVSYGYTKLAKETSKNYVYPDVKSERKFAFGKKEIKLTEVIEGIIEESGLKVAELTLPKQVANVTFTQKKPSYQKNLSDWQYLIKLAHEHGCTMFMRPVNGVESIYFVPDDDFSSKTSGDIGFLYPLKGYKDNKVKNVEANEMLVYNDPIWNRPRFIRNITVEESIPDAYSVKRSSSYIDPDTQIQVNTEVEVKDENGKKVIYVWKFEPGRVKEIHETHPEIADKIRNGSPMDMPWSSGAEKESPEYARYYYSLVRKYDDERIALFDKNWFGITISADCNQDLDIHVDRVYPVRGIFRYSSSTNTHDYYLRGLKHTWTDKGPETHLDLIY